MGEGEAERAELRGQKHSKSKLSRFSELDCNLIQIVKVFIVGGRVHRDVKNTNSRDVGAQVKLVNLKLNQGGATWHRHMDTKCYDTAWLRTD